MIPAKTSPLSQDRSYSRKCAMPGAHSLNLDVTDLILRLHPTFIRCLGGTATIFGVPSTVARTITVLLDCSQ